MAEATSTIYTDTLLDDLDDLSDVEEQNDDNEEDVATIEGEPEKEQSTLGWLHIPAFLGDESLQAHLRAIRENPADNNLIIPSNKYLAIVAAQLLIAHQNLGDAYTHKFPELSDLVVDARRYKNAVQRIGNEMDVTKIDLSDILSPNEIITISVASSTTSGRPLTPEELTKVALACDTMERLWTIQTELTEFVRNRMHDWAPNTSALVGSEIAAKLVGMAGGLAELSRIPACNLQVVGQVRSTAASRGGLSTIATKPHTGILNECDLVQSLPSHLHRKALKVVAAKLALATRCDYVNVVAGRELSAVSGASFRAEIEKRFEQWQAPDKAQTLKALPKPDLTVKKRRGGKRMRRLKERFEETEMMKQANTRAFSAQSGEYGDDAMGLTLGLMDTDGGGGALRKTTEKRKMSHANTKASRKRQAQLAKAAASSNGLESSVIFTPVQGLELADPKAQEKRMDDSNKNWFSKNARFQSAIPKGK